MSDVEKHLEHYGIKGMKWGVRRKRGPDGKVSGGGKKSSTEAKRAQAILKKAKKHGVSSLTNKELGDLNKRLQLEQSFNNLGGAKKSKTKKILAGRDAVAEVLKTGNMGIQAYNMATSPAAAAVKAAIAKKKG